MSKDPCLRQEFRPSASGRNFFFRTGNFLIFVKKKHSCSRKKHSCSQILSKKRQRQIQDQCIGGFHYRANLQKIVSMPFGKGKYFFKTILEKKNFFFFFFFFFEIFEKKSTPAPEKST